MISFSADIQVSLYECLKNNVLLMDRVSGIFDYVDEKYKFPFVTLGSSSGLPFDTRTFEGEESIETIHIWSRAKGKLETKQIMRLVIIALKDFKMKNANLEYFSVEDTDVVDDPDGKTRHGVIKIKIKVRE